MGIRLVNNLTVRYNVADERTVPIMLEKKLSKAIDVVNGFLSRNQIPCTDQSKDVMRSVLGGSSTFENVFDHTLHAEKQSLDQK